MTLIASTAQHRQPILADMIMPLFDWHQRAQSTDFELSGWHAFPRAPRLGGCQRAQYANFKTFGMLFSEAAALSISELGCAAVQKLGTLW